MGRHSEAHSESAFSPSLMSAFATGQLPEAHSATGRVRMHGSFASRPGPARAGLTRAPLERMNVVRGAPGAPAMIVVRGAPAVPSSAGLSLTTPLCSRATFSFIYL